VDFQAGAAVAGRSVAAVAAAVAAVVGADVVRRMIMRMLRASLYISLLLIAAVIAAPQAGAATQNPRPFPSPDEAVSALVAAAKSRDDNAIIDILGSSYRRWILSGDRVADDRALDRFVNAYQEKFRIENKDDKKALLIVGNDDFPFPFPLVKRFYGWTFDAEAGKEELLNRRIGQDELDVIQVLRAVVDAQREYAVRDRDDDGAPDYAMKFISSPGKRDGLYWPTAEGAPQSPLGPLVGDAVRAGYGARGASSQAQPYKGYYFRLLTRQGRGAPGGAYDYVVRGKMIGGFAVVAYPAGYGVSGIKTFMVSHDRKVYERDLGRSTGVSVAQMTAFNPDSKWKVVPDSE
jgi:hypothetical protein